MKSFSFRRPWLSASRGLSYIALGILAIAQIPNTIQPLIIVFILLYGFVIFSTLLETLVAKKEKLAGLVLVGFLSNVILLILFFMAFMRYDPGLYTIEEAGYSLFHVS